MNKQMGVKSSSNTTIPVKWRDFWDITKPRIIRTNLIAAFGGFWLASQWNIQWTVLMMMLLGTSLVMASSCVLNNYFDRDLDTRMDRTKDRATATGRMKPSIVLWYAIVLGVTGMLILFQINLLSGLLGLLGMFVYVVIYTLWLKRTSTWSTSIGGISGAMPPVIGYCAVTGRIDMGAWLLFAYLFLWQPPHFWTLAIRQREDYARAGFPLLPVVKGVERTKWQMIPYVTLLIPVSILFYTYHYAGIFFLIVSLISGGLWLIDCLKGLRISPEKTDDWAKKNFLYSIQYLTITFILMILNTSRV